MGFSGIQNFPTVGLIDGTFRQGLEGAEEMRRALVFPSIYWLSYVLLAQPA